MARTTVAVLAVITHQLRIKTGSCVHGWICAYLKRPSVVGVSFLKTTAKAALRIAATADLHYARHSRGTMQEAFTEISGSADVLLLCGDLTEYGLPEEAEELAADIRSAVRIPCIGVIGNHDYESGHLESVANILDQTGVTMLNGEAVEIAARWFCRYLWIRRRFRPADAERLGRAAD
jgi:predicted MPP superfamily phosphohydrolase